MSALPAFAPAPIPMLPAANAPVAERAPQPTSGAILAACPVAQGGVVLFGWHGARMPRQGQAVLQGAGQAARAAFRLHAWRRDGAGTAWFVAAIQAREPQSVPKDALLTLDAPGRPGITLGTLPADATAPDLLAGRLAAECAGQPGPIALFLADLAAAAPRAPTLRSLLVQFLRRAAEEDGVIEIVGQAGDALMLQGWGRIGVAEPVTMLVSGFAIARLPAHVARFQRSDIAAPATGVVLVMAQSAGIEAAELASVHLVSGAALCRRPVLPARQLLGAAETSGHLRDIAARLSGDAEAMQAVQGLLRPRFTGQDTLSTLARPVRAAIDLAVLFPGAGAYLSGWLVDPASDAGEVALANAAGARLRLDHAWTRLPRPDVLHAFRGDTRFAGLDAEKPLHGFAAFAPDPAIALSAAGLHLDIGLADTAAFLPVQPARGTQRALLRRVLESIDLHQPGAHAAIASQLGPLLQAVLRQGLDLPPAETIRRIAATPRRALLLPLAPSGAPAHVALSFLLQEPLSAEEGLVLVCPSCWAERDLAALDQALVLYGIDATVLRVAESCSWIEALEIAARATEAASLLCLGAGVMGVAPGWRAALAAERGGAAGPAVMFPTALYEDDAVRSLGVAAVQRRSGAPWAVLRRPQAGLPAAGLVDRRPARIAGSLAGALVSRAAWQEAGGFAGGGLLAEAQEFAFFRRLARAGREFAHAPDIAVYAPDDSPAGPPPRWQQAARLADGWLMAAEAAQETT